MFKLHLVLILLTTLQSVWLKPIVENNNGIEFNGSAEIVGNNEIIYKNGIFICDTLACPIATYQCSVGKISIENNTKIFISRNCTAESGYVLIQNTSTIQNPNPNDMVRSFHSLNKDGYSNDCVDGCSTSIETIKWAQRLEQEENNRNDKNETNQIITNDENEINDFPQINVPTVTLPRFNEKPIHVDVTTKSALIEKQSTNDEIVKSTGPIQNITIPIERVTSPTESVTEPITKPVTQSQHVQTTSALNDINENIRNATTLIRNDTVANQNEKTETTSVHTDNVTEATPTNNKQEHSTEIPKTVLNSTIESATTEQIPSLNNFVYLSTPAAPKSPEPSNSVTTSATSSSDTSVTSALSASSVTSAIPATSGTPATVATSATLTPPASSTTTESSPKSTADSFETMLNIFDNVLSEKPSNKEIIVPVEVPQVVNIFLNPSIGEPTKASVIDGLLDNALSPADDLPEPTAVNQPIPQNLYNFGYLNNYINSIFNFFLNSNAVRPLPPPLPIQSPPLSVQSPPLPIQSPPLSIQSPPLSVQSAPVVTNEIHYTFKDETFKQPDADTELNNYVYLQNGPNDSQNITLTSYEYVGYGDQPNEILDKRYPIENRNIEKPKVHTVHWDEIFDNVEVKKHSNVERPIDYSYLDQQHKENRNLNENQSEPNQLKEISENTLVNRFTTESTPISTSNAVTKNGTVANEPSSNHTISDLPTKRPNERVTTIRAITTTQSDKSDSSDSSNSSDSSSSSSESSSKEK